jgi:hypothetical protein
MRKDGHASEWKNTMEKYNVSLTPRGLKESFILALANNKQDVLLALIGSSIIFFLLTIYFTIPSFAYYPGDAFYYFRSLPAFYWIGISITVLPLIIPSYNGSKIILVIMLGLYLHGLPVFLYDNPRHADVYSHEASTIALLNNRGFPAETEYYSREYPGAFLFQGIQLFLTGMPHFVLLKFMSAFLIVLPGVIIYLIVKEVYPTLASLTPLIFFATFINDQAHFSPQLFALSFFLTLLLGIQRVSLYDKRIEKAWIIVTILAIIIVNISNPTQSYFLLGNLLVGFILMKFLRKPFHWNNKIIEDRIWTLLILTMVIFTSWSAYIGLGKAIYEPSDLSENFLSSLTSPSLNRIPIHPNPPDESVYVATYIGYALRIGTVLMGIMTFVILYLRRKFLTNRNIIPYLIITAAFFVVCMSFIPFALFESTTHTFLLRAIMYAGISWSISIPFFINLQFRNKVARSLKYLPVAFGIVSIMLMPIAKYGADYLSFVPSSQIYMAHFIDQHSRNAYGLLPITDSTWHIFFYYHTLNHNSSLSVLRPYPDEYRLALAEGIKPVDYILPLLQEWTYSHPNQLVVSFGYQSNLFILHEGDNEYVSGLEEYMKSQHNLVSYAGQARTYVTRP